MGRTRRVLWARFTHRRLDRGRGFRMLITGHGSVTVQAWDGTLLKRVSPGKARGWERRGAGRFLSDRVFRLYPRRAEATPEKVASVNAAAEEARAFYAAGRERAAREREAAERAYRARLRAAARAINAARAKRGWPVASDLRLLWLMRPKPRRRLVAHGTSVTLAEWAARSESEVPDPHEGNVYGIPFLVTPGGCQPIFPGHLR